MYLTSDVAQGYASKEVLVEIVEIRPLGIRR